MDTRIISIDAEVRVTVVFGECRIVDTDKEVRMFQVEKEERIRCADYDN
jgi:hypothetical protein